MTSAIQWWSVPTQHKRAADFRFIDQTDERIRSEYRRQRTVDDEKFCLSVTESAFQNAVSVDLLGLPWKAACVQQKFADVDRVLRHVGDRIARDLEALNTKDLEQSCRAAVSFALGISITE